MTKRPTDDETFSAIAQNYFMHPADAARPCQATPSRDLRHQIMSPTVPKNEREWWAARRIEELERENAVLQDEVRRAGIWAANLSMHAHDMKRKAEDFIRGVSATTWKTNEPRVIGFKLEFDAMVSSVAQPTPAPPPKA